MLEIWKDIKGYEDKYKISNLGRVKSLKGKPLKGKILSIYKDKFGYVCVRLSKDNIQRTYRVHRLVAYAFLPNPNNYPEVNHKDEDRTNNCVNNLEWCSVSYNRNYGTRTMAPNLKRGVKCITTNKEFDSIGDAAIYYNTSKSGIIACCKGQFHHSGKLPNGTKLEWEYLD